MIDTPDINLSKSTKEVVDLLTAAQKDLKELDAKLDGEEAALNFMDETVKKIGDKELIHLINQLKIYGNYCILALP